MGAGPRTGFRFSIDSYAEGLFAISTANIYLYTEDFSLLLRMLMSLPIFAGIELTAFSTVPILTFKLDALFEMLSIVAPLHARRGKLCGSGGPSSLSQGEPQ